MVKKRLRPLFEVARFACRMRRPASAQERKPAAFIRFGVHTAEAGMKVKGSRRRTIPGEQGFREIFLLRHNALLYGARKCDILSLI
ncbi:MAG TPA: hypothetical protein PKW41_07340 [Clostridia bacterium]|jgi:hypothetical protein|nr:hypothetical protein [Clostridia bacterium]